MSTLPPPPSADEKISDPLYRWLYLAYTAINNASGGGPTGTFGPPGVTTPDEALVPNSNRSLDYLNLTQLALGTDPIFSSANEINQLYQSNIQKSTLTDLQNSSTYAHNVNITVGTEVTNVVSVTLQFLNASGNVLSSQISGTFFLSDSDTTINYTNSPPSSSISVGTAGDIVDITTTLNPGSLFNFITDATGVLNVNVTHTTAGTWYMGVVLPYGRLALSTPITFT